MRVSLADRPLDDGAPCLVVADVGENHDGDLARATALVSAAARAGAEAVHFDAGCAADGCEGRGRRALRPEWYARLRSHARAEGLLFLASAGDVRRAELLAALGLPAMCAAAAALGRGALLEALGRFGRPVIVATGGAPASAVEAALEAVGRGAGAGSRRPPIVLVAGTAKPDASLQEISSLRARHGPAIGWSDRAPGHALATAAVALGARLVVKGLTDDRARPGAGHATALVPDELAALARAVREIEGALRGRRTWQAGEGALESAPCPVGSSPRRSSPT